MEATETREMNGAGGASVRKSDHPPEACDAIAELELLEEEATRKREALRAALAEELERVEARAAELRAALGRKRRGRRPKAEALRHPSPSQAAPVPASRRPRKARRQPGPPPGAVAKSPPRKAVQGARGTRVREGSAAAFVLERLLMGPASIANLAAAPGADGFQYAALNSAIQSLKRRGVVERAGAGTWRVVQ